MPSKQIGHVLQHVRDAQRDLAQRFDELSQESDDARVQFLLDYLKRQEDRLNDVLDSYQDDVSEGILETWVQFVDEDKLDRVAAEAKLPGAVGPDSIIAAALAFDDAVLALYTEVAESTSAPDVEELFKSLARMEEAARRQFARATLDI